MVVIRLTRHGARNRPFFNIIVTDSRNPRDGRFIERLGFYNPVSSNNTKIFQIKKNRLIYWQSVGAQLSNTVKRLLKNK